MIGGWGRCTGRGAPAYPWTFTNSPRTGELVARAVRLEQRDDLLELGDSPARAVEGQPHRVVLVAAPAGADAELEPAVGEQVERRGLLRKHGGHVVVDAEHPAADAQRLGDAAAAAAIAAIGARSWRGVRAARCAGPGPEVVIGKERAWNSRDPEP